VKTISLIIMLAHGLFYAVNTSAKEGAINPITKLAFLLGSWEGPGITYLEDGEIQEYVDTEYLRFDLDKRLLLIDAKGVKDGQPYYQLHTVVYFDTKAGHYVYTPFSGGRPSSFTCNLANQRFICLNAKEDYRLTFRRLEDGRWNEFGEKLTGKDWVKRFETILKPSTLR